MILVFCNRLDRSGFCDGFCEFREVLFTDNGGIPNLGEILTDMRGEEVVFVMSGLHNDEIFTEILLIEKMR